MGQWTLPGPDDLTLTREQLCSLLKLSASTLDRMIADGRFPRGIKPSPGTEPIWTGCDLAAWLHLAARMEPRDEKKS